MWPARRGREFGGSKTTLEKKSEIGDKSFESDQPLLAAIDAEEQEAKESGNDG